MADKLVTWWKDRGPTKRRLIQLYCALLYNANLKGFVNGEIYKGSTKSLCVPGLNCYSCPGAVGACPLGSLQASLAASNKTPGFYIFGILLLYGLIAGRTICGWACPMGLIQELLHKIPTPKIKKSKFTRGLSYLKYIILIVFAGAIPLWYGIKKGMAFPGFCKYICPAGTFEGAMGLLANPKNTNFFGMLGIYFTRKFIIMLIIALACIFCYRAFCRFLCPLGAIYGMFNSLSLMGVRVDIEKCSGCGVCTGKCKMDVKRIGDHECIHCGQCIGTCARGAISLKAGKYTLKAQDKEVNVSEENNNKVRKIEKYVGVTAAIVLLAALLWFGDRDAGKASKTSGTDAVTASQETQIIAAGPEAVTDTDKISGNDPQRYVSNAPTGYNVGDQLADFSAVCMDGSTFALSEKRGRVVVINLWATWCGPCVEELPYFNEFVHKYGDDVAVLACHSRYGEHDDVYGDVNDFLKDKGWDTAFTVDDDENGIFSKTNGSGTLPQTIVLNRKGEVIYNEIRSITPDMLDKLYEKAAMGEAPGEYAAAYEDDAAYEEDVVSEEASLPEDDTADVSEMQSAEGTEDIEDTEYIDDTEDSEIIEETEDSDIFDKTQESQDLQVTEDVKVSDKLSFEIKYNAKTNSFDLESDSIAKEKILSYINKYIAEHGNANEENAKDEEESVSWRTTAEEELQASAEGMTGYTFVPEEAADTNETADEQAAEADIEEDHKEAETEEANESEETSEDSIASKGDDLVSTKHTATIHGEKVDYTATAGTMAVSYGDEVCDIFFIAYTRDGVKDKSERPITFTFNGGPGSASMYTNFLCMGPKRMELDESGHASSLPARLVDNENSLLDMTDLVFIDAVGTGYSRARDKDTEDDFIGYNNDVRTIGDFIRLYINRNKRWGSPKYVAGESYGTTRAVGLCEYLTDEYSLGLNGLMLISSVNNFEEVSFGPGNDTPYAVFIPTYAADAWYHDCLDKKYQKMELEDFLDEVRDFVSDEYVPALFAGKSLSDDDKEEIAEKLADYTGLSKKYVLKSNLRIYLDDFCKELLSDEKLMTGRLDGRYTGPVIDGSIGDGTSDPSGFDVDVPLTGVVNQYITEELDYQTDTPYLPLSPDVNSRWSFDSDNAFLSQEETIYNVMSTNSWLKVWVLCGYYDGATPFYGSEWVYDHVFIDDSRKDNLSFTYYPAGHMFYLDEESFDKFREDAEDWYHKSS